MKFSPLWYVVGGLVIVIILLILFQPKPDDSKERQLQADIDSRDQEISKLHGESLKQAEKRKADSLAFTISIRTHKDRGEKLTREIAHIKANPIVIKVRDSIPEVDSAFQNYESLIAEQDKQIKLQAKYIDTLRIDMAGIETNFNERLTLQAATIEDLTRVSEEQRKQLRKTRRTVKLLKVVAVIGTVAGVFAGSSF